MDIKRARILKEGKKAQGPVVYWMSRDQRVRDNGALLYARKLAAEQKQPLAVLFCLVPAFLGATLRQYGFMLKGLAEVEADLAKKNVAFFILPGEPGKVIPKFISKHKVSALITDFDPLRIKKTWKAQVAGQVNIPVIEVDAHNIVPCWIASPKQEFAAYTFRPKISRLLPEYLKEMPPFRKYGVPWKGTVSPVDWARVEKRLKVDRSVPEVDWIRPGEKQARKTLRQFLLKKIGSYHDERNDPNRDAPSNLSPYLHFGQISAQRVALEAQGFDGQLKSQESFLEELIVRRELSDNFCYYNDHYDRFDSFPDWAIKTLDDHREDPREYIYSSKEFEEGLTHDPLWNAAQMEMVVRGKMHGYMRMYWAKKILEWTRSPEEALEIAITLNDRYELDGRDPNGYTGVAWSIGGVHDRAWGERPVFGKVRFMSYNGCRTKFNVKAYIQTNLKQ